MGDLTDGSIFQTVLVEETESLTLLIVMLYICPNKTDGTKLVCTILKSIILY